MRYRSDENRGDYTFIGVLLEDSVFSPEFVTVNSERNTFVSSHGESGVPISTR